MAFFPFDLPTMEAITALRTPGLTQLFLLISEIGDIQGYVLIGTLIYVMFDKQLAVRLSILVLLASCLNHVLKISIGNPRPFMQEGDYLQKWAVSPDNARELAAEYSTPSGHAIAAASFYAYLYGRVRSPPIRIVAVLAIVLIGLSRPYLGVHYVGDILLGWAVGLGTALIALRYADGLSLAWSRLPWPWQIGISITASLVVWIATLAINDWHFDGQPRAFMGAAGTMTGIVIARRLELGLVNFDPRSGSVPAKIMRYLLTVAFALLTLKGLGAAFSAIADNFSLAGYLLQYLRYAAVGFVSLFLAPLIFTRIGLAGVDSRVAAPLATRD